MTKTAFDGQRRKFLGTSMVVASAAVAGSGVMASAHAQTPAGSAKTGGPVAFGQPSSRRKLGQLEVSSIGLGVQNMARTYQTTVPARPLNTASLFSTPPRPTARLSANGYSAKPLRRSGTKS